MACCSKSDCSPWRMRDKLISFIALANVAPFCYCALQLEVDKSRLIGPLNVFPMSMIAPNCLAWMGYAIYTNNVWLWWSNFPSLLLGLWYMSIALRAVDLSDRYVTNVEQQTLQSVVSCLCSGDVL